MSFAIIMRKYIDETVKKLEFHMPVAFHSHVMLKQGNDVLYITKTLYCFPLNHKEKRNKVHIAFLPPLIQDDVDKG